MKSKFVVNNIFFIFLLSSIIACTSTEKPKKKAQEVKKEVTQTKQVPGLKSNGFYKNVQEIAEGESSPEQVNRFNRLIELLKNSSKVEYVFYLPNYSMSTEVDNPQQVQMFALHVSPFDAANTKCDLQAGMAFKNAEGDIHLEMDAAITQDGCRYIRTKFDGQVYNLGMTESGYQHLMQFLNIKPSDGKPIEK